MALQQKKVVATGRFVPSRPEGVGDPTVRKAHQWDNFVKWLPTIKWASLNEEEYKQQWGNCLNALNVLENAGAVTTADLWPHFNRYLRLKGYSDAEKTILRSDKRDIYINFGIVSKAYLLMVGNVDTPFCRATDAFITKQLKAYLAKRPATDDAPVVKRSADAKQRDKFSELMGELYALEDDFEEVDIATFLSERGVAKDLLQAIEERFSPRMEELAQALRGKDEQLVEAYARYSKSEIKAMIAWYEALLEGVASYRDAKAVRAPRAAKERAPRAKKEKPPEKVASKIKYVERSDELKIESLPPKKLVGCDAVYLYSLKYKRIVVYYALPGKEITVSGAHFENWDPATSFQKQLRKPKEQLAEFMNIPGKAGCRTWLAAVKTSGRPNRAGMMAESLILKVFK